MIQKRVTPREYISDFQFGVKVLPLNFYGGIKTRVPLLI